MKRMLTDEERIEHRKEALLRYQEKRKASGYQKEKEQKKSRYSIGLTVPITSKDTLVKLSEKYNGSVQQLFIKSVEEKYSIDLSLKNEDDDED